MSEIYARKRSTTWSYRFEIASVNGKRKECTKSGFATKKEALEAGAKAYAEYNQAGEVFKPSEISVADFYEKWLQEYCSVNVKPSTIEAYRKKLRLYILPYIGEYRLRALTPSVLQDFINTMFNNGYSRNTLTVMKSMLTGALSYAVEPLHYIQYNPAQVIKLPGKRATPKKETRKKPRRPVTLEEWQQIMQRFPVGHPAHIPLVLAYTCGMRLGEVFGLMWEDIDFNAATMRIDRQIQMDEKEKHWYFSAPKYDSYRVISLDAATLEMLRDEKEKQARARVYYAGEYKQITCISARKSEHFFDSGYIGYAKCHCKPVNMVMQRDCGEYIQPRIMQHTSRIIHGSYKAGYPVISADFDFHSLRHTHATMLAEIGVPLPVIQQRLGHAKIEMTEHYSNHVTATMENSFKATLKDMYKKSTLTA